jgi:hypothetical protein
MIEGKWTDPYTQELGILDHCVEVIELKNNVRRLKALGDQSNLIRACNTISQLEREMMDLYLILERKFKDSSELKNAREMRFKEKEMEGDK